MRKKVSFEGNKNNQLTKKHFYLYKFIKVNLATDKFAGYSALLPSGVIDFTGSLFKQKGFSETHVKRKWTLCILGHWCSNILVQIVPIRELKIEIC